METNNTKRYTKQSWDLAFPRQLTVPWLPEVQAVLISDAGQDDALYQEAGQQWVEALMPLLPQAAPLREGTDRRGGGLSQCSGAGSSAAAQVRLPDVTWPTCQPSGSFWEVCVCVRGAARAGLWICGGKHSAHGSVSPCPVQLLPGLKQTPGKDTSVWIRRRKQTKSSSSTLCYPRHYRCT